MKLSRELWLQIEPLLSTALDMDRFSRAAWLVDLDRTHPDAAPLLRRMLKSHERAELTREMETVPRLVAVPNWSSAHSMGARIGPFDIIAPLGHGGMGEVWLARQSDGRIERNVALKLPALNQQGQVWRERFRRERDILAKLEHPHIARLYDAGITETGQPWLAMEFVEGLSLSEHVAARSPSIAERLVLFRQVLAAVAHAHRRLVVHRDLKPPNILIDTSGQVKLLDFGIAKLVDEVEGAGTSGDLTRLGGRVMTLRYAAPEQVAAGDITTATDIYALGVILHELLTGLSPYRAVREGRALTDVMLLQEPTVVPSTLVAKQQARLLAGDLDAIVLKAMRRDPAARYASVELFDGDILAHLEKRPVTARAGTWRYLAGRFVLRHKLPLATAAAIVVTLLAGLVMAERERNVAVAEKARAERHLASVRKLANTFIFDVHAKIENLPGSLDARELIIKTSLEYLDALSGEAARDPGLTYSIAAGYRDIGNIQGQPGRASKGDLAAAIRNFEKSKRLFVELERSNPTDIATAREHRKLSNSLTLAYAAVPDARWEEEAAETLRLSERIASATGASAADRSLLPLARIEKAYLAGSMEGAGPEAVAAIAGAIGDLESLVQEAPGEIELRERLAAVYHWTGKLLGYAGRTPQSVREAIAYLQKARTLIASVRIEAPGDANKQALAAAILYDLAMIQRVGGELRQADQAMLEGLALSQRLVAADPSNADLAMDRLRSLAGASHLAIKLEDLPRAARHAREALAIAAGLPEPVRRSNRVRINVANAQAGLGYALLASAGPAAGDRKARLALLLEARANLAQAAAFLAVMRAEKNLGAFPDDEVRNFEEKVKRCDEAIARLEAA